MAQWWTGKGYGVSKITDVSGRPLLTYQGPNDKTPMLLADRVAQIFDFTVRQPLTAGAMANARLASQVASAAKKILGGGTDDELDHKISLELGGSNTPSNLFVQQGITAGPSAASDTLENNLALDVVAGKISLLEAWRTLEDQKGFLLTEDMPVQQKTQVVPLLKQFSGYLKDYITGSKKPAGVQQNYNFKNDLQRLTDAMKKNPLNQVLQTNYLLTQHQSNVASLGVNAQDSAKTTKSFLAAYTESKGINPREMIGATNLNIQRIIDNSKKSPNIYGVPSSAILGIVAGMQLVGGILITGGVILIVIAIITVGPELAIAALAEGGIALVAEFLGMSVFGSLGIGAVSVGVALPIMSIGVNMLVKEFYDNSYLLPTQNISALKDALAIQKGLAGFLPSAVTTPADVAPKTVKKTTTVVAPTSYKVVAPNGKTYVFKTQAALNQFRSLAGF